jgi:hypothetical protein
MFVLSYLFLMFVGRDPSFRAWYIIFHFILESSSINESNKVSTSRKITTCAIIIRYKLKRIGINHEDIEFQSTVITEK